MARKNQRSGGTVDFADMRVGLYCRVSKSDPDNPDPREKSTGDQESVGRRWVDDHGARLVEVYSDEGITASRFGKKARAEYDRLLADVEACRLDVIWCWEQSRLSRKPREFHALLDLCRDNGVWWVIKDQAVDPGDYKATLAPGMMSMIDAISSEQTSERVQRGLEALAHDGKPTGVSAYGYKRLYHPETKKLHRVVPDESDDDGRPIEDTPAGIVREIFERIAAGDSINSLRLDFHRRGVRSPRGLEWWGSDSIARLALRRVYIGQRIHQGEVLEGVDVVWPPLVTEELFWKVNRVLVKDDERPAGRPSRARHLLSMIARCAKCGQYLQRCKAGNRPNGTYVCRGHGCVGISQDRMDDLVETRIVAWLSDPDVFAAVTAVDDSAGAAQARADLDRARVELEEWRQLADRGDVTAVSFARAEKGLLTRIRDAEERIRSSSVPPVLDGRLGPDAEAAWESLSLEVRRQVVKAVADIRVRPVGRKMGSSGVRTQDRVEWRWLLGPDTAVHLPAVEHVGGAVTVNEDRALAMLTAGPILQKDFPPRMGLARTTAAYTVSRLVERGWVERTPTAAGPTGRPTFTLTLTDEGRKVAADHNGESS